MSSAASYSYSETSTNAVQQANQPATQSNISNCSASATANTKSQERKVSSLKLTPITIPDPPAHYNSYLDPNIKTADTLPSTSSPQKPQTIDSPLTKTASISVLLGPENLKHQEPPKDSVELKVPDQVPNQAPAQSRVEITVAPPAVPPRPSPAQLLVNKRLHSSTTAQKRVDVHLKTTWSEFTSFFFLFFFAVWFSDIQNI